MDDRHRAPSGESGTEPGVQAASLTLPPRPRPVAPARPGRGAPACPRRRPRPGRRAGAPGARSAVGCRALQSRGAPSQAGPAVSPRRRGRSPSPCRRCRSGTALFHVAEGHRESAIREETVDVVGPLSPAIHGRDAAERAAADPRCRQERLRDRCDGRLGEGHGASVLVGCGTCSAAEPSTAGPADARRRRYCRAMPSGEGVPPARSAARPRRRNRGPPGGTSAVELASVSPDDTPSPGTPRRGGRGSSPSARRGGRGGAERLSCNERSERPVFTTAVGSVAFGRHTTGRSGARPVTLIPVLPRPDHAG